MKLRSRKGMSMVEVVIALVIISVISASALSMIMMSVNVEADAVRSFEVSESVDNAMDCFRFAETPAEFLEALKMTALYEQDPENPDRFLLKAAGFTVTVTVSGDQFEYTAVNVDGEVIYAFTYHKGSTAANPAQTGEGGGEN